MSWAVDEWKVGLNHRTLAKISEIENHNERLRKETKQKQFQLESLEAAFGKQKQKTEDEKSQISILKRENSSLTEACGKLEQKVDRLNHEMRNKDTLLSSLEDQVQRCKRQIELSAAKTSKLLNNDDVNQRSQVLSLKITELESQLKTERNKTLSLEKQILDSNKSKRTKQGYVPSLPWATDDNFATPQKKKSQMQPVVDLLTGSPLALSGQGSGDSFVSMLPPSNQQEVENLKTSLEKANKFVKELELKFQKEGQELRAVISEKESLLVKQKDEAAKLQLLLDQGNTKIAEFERRFTQVSEELKCERHNAEASRTSLQNKLHEEEKAKKRELSTAHDSLRSFEKQLNDAKSKHAQELTQLKNEMRQLQSDLDKASFSRNKLEGELKTAQNQLLQAEQLHQADTNKMSQLNVILKELNQGKMQLEASLGNASSKAASSDANLKKEKQLAQAVQGKLVEANRLLSQKEKELEDLKASADARAKTVGNNLENMRLQLADVEDKKSKAEKLIKQKEREINELSLKLSNMENTSMSNLQKLEKGQKEISNLAKENSMLSDQNVSTVAQLKKSRQELEQLKVKYDEELLAANLNLERAKSIHQKEADALKQSIEREKLEMQKENRNELNCRKKSEEELNQTISQLKANLSDESDKLVNVTNELQSLKAAVSDREEHAEKLRKNVQDLKAKEKKLDSELAELQKKLSSALDSEKQTLEAKTCLEEQYKNLVLESQADSIEKRSLEGRVQDLETQVESLKLQKRDDDCAQVELEKAQASIAALGQQLANAQLVANAQLQKIQSFESEAKTLRESLSKAAKEKSENAEELKNLTASVEGKIADYEGRLSAGVKEMLSMRSKHDELTKLYEASCQKVTSLYKQLNAVDTEKQELTGKLAVAEQMIAETNGRLSTTLNHYATRENEIKKLQRSLDEKISELGLSRAAYSQTKMRCEQFNEKLLLSQADKSKLEVDLKDLEKTCEELAAEKSQLKLELETVVSDWKSQTDALNSALSQKTTEVTRCQSDYDKLKSDLQAAVQSLDEANSEKDAKLKYITELKEEAVALKQVIEDKTAAHESVVERYSESLASAEQEAVDVKKEMESIKLSLDAMTSEKKRSDNVAEERMKKAISCEEELSAAKAQHEILLSQLDAAQQSSQASANDAKNSSAKLVMVEQCLKEKDDLMGKLSSEIAEMQTEFSTKIKALENLHSNLKSDFEQVSSQYAKSMDVANVLDADNKKLKATVEELTLECGKSQGAAELLQMDLEDKDEVISNFETVTVPNLEALLASARASNQDKESELLSLNNEVVKLNHLLSSAQDESEVRLADLNSRADELEKLQSINGRLREQVEAQEECVAKLQDQLHDLQVTHDALVTEKQTVSNDLQALSSALEQQEKHVVDKERRILSMTEECHQWQVKAENLATENNENLSQLKSLKDTQAELKLLNENLESKISLDKDHHAASISVAEEELKRMLTELDSSKEQLKQAEVTLRDSQTVATNLEGLCERLTADNSDLREENETMTRELEQSQMTIEELQQQTCRLNQRLEETEQADIQRVAEFREKMEDVQKEQREHLAAIAELEVQLSTKDAALDDEKKCLSELQHKIVTFEELESNLRSQIKTLQEQFDALQLTKEQICKEVDLAHKKIEGLESELREIVLKKQNQIRSLESSLEAADVKQNELKNQLDDAVSRLEEEVNKRMCIESDCQTLKLQEERLKLSNAAHEEKVASLLSQVEELTHISCTASKEHESTLIDLKAARELAEEVSQKSESTFAAMQTEVLQLKDESAALRDANGKLENTCNEQSLALNDAETSLSEKATQLEHLIKLHDEVILEKADLTKEIESSRTNMESVSNQLQQKELDLEETRSDLLKQLAEQKSKSEAIIEECASRATSLDQDITILKRSLEEKADNENTLTERLSTLERDLQDLCRKNESLISHNNILEGEISSLKAEHQQMQVMLQNESEEKSNALKSLDELLAKHSEQAHFADELEQKMKACLRESQDRLDKSSLKIAELTASLEMRDDDIESLNLELESVKESLQLRNSAVEAFEREKLATEKQLLETQDAVSTLTKQYNDQTQEMKLLQTKSDEQFHDSQVELQSVRSQVEALTSNVLDKESKLMKITEELLKSSSTVEQVTEELEEVKQQLMTVQTNSFQSSKNSEEKLSDLTNELSISQQALDEKAKLLEEIKLIAEEKAKEKEILICRYEQTIEELNAEKTRSAAEEELIQKAAEAAETEVNKLSGLLAAEQEKTAHLDSDMAVYKAKVEEQDMKMKVLDAKLQETNRLNEELFESDEKSQKQIHSLKADLEAKLADAQASDENIAKLCKEKDDLALVIGDLEDEILRLKTLVRENEERSDRALKENSESQRLKFQLESEIRELKQCLQCSEEKLSLVEKRESETISQLEETIAEMKEEADSSLHRQAESISEKCQMIDDLSRTVSGLNSDLEQEAAQHRSAKQDCEAAKEKLSDVQEMLEKKENERQDLMQKCQDLDRLLLGVRGDLSRVQTEVSQKEDEVAQLKLTCESWQERYQEVNGSEAEDLHSLKMQCSMLRADNSKLAVELESERNVAEQRAAELDTLRSKLEDTVSQVQAEQEKLCGLETALRAAQDESVTCRSQCNDTKTLLDDLQEQVWESDAKVSSLRAESEEKVEKLRRQLAEVENMAMMKTSESNELKERADSERQKASELELKLIATEKQMKHAAKLVDEYQEAQRKHFDAASLAEKEFHQVRRELELDQKEKQERLNKIESQLEKKTSALDESVAKIAQQTLSIQELQSRCDQLQLDYESAEHSRKAAESSVELLGNKLGAAENAMSDQSCEKSAIDSLISEKELRIDELVLENETLTNRMKAETNDLVSKVELVKRELEKQKESVQHEMEVSSELRHAHRALEESMSAKIEELSSARESSQSLSEQLDHFKYIQSSLLDEKDSLTGQVQCLELDKTNLVEETAILREDIVCLKEQQAEKEKEVGRLREKMSVLEGVLDEAQAANTHMSSQLKHLNDVIAQEATNFKSKCRRLERDNELLASDNQKIQEQLKCALQRSSSDNEDLMQLKKSQLEAETMCNKLLEEKGMTEAAKQKLIDDFTSLKDEYATLKVAFDDVEIMLREASTESEEKQKQLDKAEVLLRHSHEALDSLHQKLREEREKVDENQQTKVTMEIDLKGQVSELSAEVDRLTDSLAEAEQKAEKKLEEQMQKVQEHSKKLTRDFEVLSKQVMDSESIKSELEAEVEKLKHELQEQERKHRVDKEVTARFATEKVNSVMEDFSELKLEVDKSDTEKLRLQEEVAQLQQQVSEKDDDERVKKLESINVTLSKELNQMKGKLQLMTGTARKKEKQLIQLQAQIEAQSQGSETRMETRTSRGHMMDASKKSQSSLTSTTSVSQESNDEVTSRRRSTRGRKSVGKKTLEQEQAPAPSQNLATSLKTPSKKSKLSDDSSTPSSPVYQMEGLPRLVDQGFTNIPRGFPSPFVLRRHQLSHTSRLVAEAMAKKKTNESGDVTRDDTSTDSLNKTPAEPAASHRVQTRSKSRKSIETSQGRLRKTVNRSRHSTDSDPLATVTNSPSKGEVKSRRASNSWKPLAAPLSSSVSSTGDRLMETAEPECKVQ